MYLYGTKSMRLESGVRTKQKCIGKFDKENNILIKNCYCDNWLKENDISIDDITSYLLSKGFDNINITNKSGNKKTKNLIIDDINTVLSQQPSKSFGTSHLMYNIANEIGLSNVLKQLFPTYYNEILTLAIFQVATQDPDLHYEHWIKKNHIPVNYNNLNSKMITNLYQSFDLSAINNFYCRWADFLDEAEYLVYDDISFINYSTKYDNLSSEYNSNNVSLNHFNLCLLLGEITGLPTFPITYNGSIDNVKTFCNTIELFKQQRQFTYKLIIDKNFFSLKNLDYMLKNDKEIPFTTLIPNSQDLFKFYAHKDGGLPNKATITFRNGSDIYFNRTFIHNWNGKNRLFIHVYFNGTESRAKNTVKTINYAEMANLAFSNPSQFKDDLNFKKYFNFSKSSVSRTGYDVKMIYDQQDLDSDDGLFILISNIESDPMRAFKIYRNKNVAINAFNIFKNYVHSKNLKLDSIQIIIGKIFIDFLSLILFLRVHKIMDFHDLYYDYGSMKEMFSELNLWNINEVGSKIITYPITNKQKQLFEYFKCKIPSADVVD
jgi:hypothetical protein